MSDLLKDIKISQKMLDLFEKNVLNEQKIHIVAKDYEKRVDLTENEISSLWRLYGSEGGNSRHKSAQNNIMNIMKATQYLRLSFYFRKKTPRQIKIQTLNEVKSKKISLLPLFIVVILPTWQNL